MQVLSFKRSELCTSAHYEPILPLHILHNTLIDMHIDIDLPANFSDRAVSIMDSKTSGATSSPKPTRVRHTRFPGSTGVALLGLEINTQGQELS